METTNSHVPPARRRGWLRKLCWVLGGLMVLLVIAGFVVTSGAFFKGVVLPRVGAAMNAEVTVSEASIRPFSRVVLQGLEVKPSGAETLLTAGEIRLSYRLMSILRGDLVIDEVTMDRPVLQVVQNADGTSNLDPILEAQRARDESTPAPAPDEESRPPRIDIRKVAMNDGTLRLVKNHTGGQRDLIELSTARFSLEDLKNAGAGKLELGANLRIDQNPPAPGTNASLQAKIEGGFRFELTADLEPRAVQGETRLDVSAADGAFADMEALRMVLNCDWSPVEIQELSLTLEKAETNLAAMTVNGPFDSVKRTGALDVRLWGVDRQLLDLLGAPWGARFNATTLASTNQIEFAGETGLITANGRFVASKFSVTQMAQTSPELDFSVDYDLTLNQAVLELQTAQLDLAPTQRSKNRIDASGKIDLADLEAITGRLRLTAETLDATEIYAAWETAAPAPGTTAPPDPGTPEEVEAELEAMSFPFRDFVCEVEIGRFWLREVELDNWLTRVRLDGGRMVVDPLKLNLNGAPVAGFMDFNFGVAGSEYELRLNADRVPVEPWVNSLLPEYQGQAKGDLTGQVQIKGAGTTDASLRANLSGENSLTFTNAAIQTDVLTKMFGALERSSNVYVRTAWRLLEPTSLPFKILNPLLTSLSSKLLLGDLSTLPLSGIDARASIREGNINTDCHLWSPAFAMNVGGDVTMAAVLTNSPIRDWPVRLSLARGLAEKVPYLTSTAPTNAAYVPLPSLFTVKGTLGSPTTSFDTAAFAQLTAQSLLQGQRIGGVDAGQALQGLGDLLRGKKSADKPDTTESSGGAETNAPASPLDNLLERLNRPKP
jgi:uncharacterized protein involved in outer membrane biogenesis